MLKKILRFVWITLAVLIGCIVFFLAVSIAPIDRDVDRHEQLALMQERIKALVPPKDSGEPGSFRVGFAKESITPVQRTATAGYAKRRGKLFESIRDSIFVRTIVIDNGAQRVAIVSADLLVIPPMVTALLEKELPQVGFTLDNTYLGAIHSHNSIGNWADGAMGFLFGHHSDSVVRMITDKIKVSIQKASANQLPSVLKSGVISVPEAVHNRLVHESPVDSLLRVVEVHRSDSSKILLMNYTAHATCLYSRDLRLSRDYPGTLVDMMEAQGYTFSMFMAGAVGSHGCSAPEFGDTCIDWMAEKVSEKFTLHRSELSTVKDSTVLMYRVPLALSDPQPKISKDWRTRAWVFDAAFGDFPTYLTVLRVGNIVMLGTPCDFSGEFDPELDALAAKHGLQSMVTSFNGGYIGYVTPEKYFDEDNFETRIMNWYGPGNGEYLEKCMEQLILKVADSK